MPEEVVKVVNSPTAKFLLNSSSDWEHDVFNQRVSETAVALNEAATKEDRKKILDVSLGLALEAMMKLSRSTVRFACFLCLAYKPEKLFKLDLVGITFRNDEEAFEYWIREFLASRRFESQMISKVKHYLLLNDDMDLIERLTFEKAWLFSKYQKLLNAHNFTIPEATFVWAENPKVTAAKVTVELDWTKTRLNKTRDYRETEGSDPPPLLVKVWEDLHTKEREKISDKYTKKKDPPTDPLYHKLNNILGGLMKGDAKALSRFYHTLFEDIFPKEYDLGEGVLSFIHDIAEYNLCFISGKVLSKADPMEIHHIQSRGSMTDRRFGNLIPIAQSVHAEINNYGINTVMEKYGVTAELIIAQGFRVTMEYIQWIESCNPA